MSIKTRQTTATMPGYTYNSKIHWIGPPEETFTSNVFTSNPGSFVDSYEYIDSHKGSDGRYRPCEHLKWKLSRHIRLDLYPDHRLPHNGGRWARCQPVPSISTGSNYMNPEDLLQDCKDNIDLALSDQEWYDMNVFALSRMLPSMYRGLSTINALIELKDFRFLFQKSPKVTLRNLRNYLNRLRGGRVVKANGKVGAHLPLKEISQLVLFKEFAVDPLISDIRRTYEDLLKFEERLKYLEKRADRVLVGHFKTAMSGYSLPGTTSGSLQVQSFTGGRWASTRFERIHDWVIPPTHTATCKYTYAIDGRPGAARRAKALLDALGVRNDVSIIWNAIPFTFIIDWFVNVSNFLESFAADNLRFKVKILDFCSSVKVSSTSRVNCFQRDSSWSGGSITDHPSETVLLAEGKFYERRVGAPNLRHSLQMSGLSGNEAFLSAALFGANRRR